ncbi:transcriptional regulator of acetoin/glycerol metabolism [Oxalobacteraceae bacterium GrIS 1.11]
MMAFGTLTGAILDYWTGRADPSSVLYLRKRQVCARRARKLRKRGVDCCYCGRTSTGKAKFGYWVHSGGQQTARAAQPFPNLNSHM